VDRSH
jgi:glyoxylase I family protein